MSRAQLKMVVTDQRGNALRNAKVHVYETQTTTPVTDLYTAKDGGVLVAGGILTSNTQGEIEGYLDDERDVALVVTDNGHTAVYAADPAKYAHFADFTEDPVPVYEDPLEENADDTPFIGLFTAVSAAAPKLPTAWTRVGTTGYATVGVGAAIYVYDAAVTALTVAANPRTQFLAANGRGYRLTGDEISVKSVGAVGDGVTDDTAAVQAATNWALARQIGMYFPTGTYRVENVTTTPAESLRIRGDGARASVLKLRDDDGLGGLGQILLITDVISFSMHDIGFHGNYDNAKSSSTANHLVKYRTTVVSAGRKDCVFDMQRCRFEQSAKGYGHAKVQTYENATAATAAEMARVSVRNCVFVGTGHLGQAFGVRGACDVVEVDNVSVHNAGKYGTKTVGLSPDEVGSSATPFGFSTEPAYGQYIRALRISNVATFNCHGSIYMQMVANSLVENVTAYEEATNSYWDSAAIPFTADAAADTITTTIPSDRSGVKAVVRFTTTGTLPAGLSANVLYFVKQPVTGGNTFQLSTTSEGTAVDITDAGSGVHSIQFLGYTYMNCIKLDDCIWDNANNPSTHLFVGIVQVKSSVHTSMRSLVIESSFGGANTSITGRATVRDSHFNRPMTIGDAYPSLMATVDNCLFEGGWVPPIGTVGALTTVSYGTSSPLSLIGGIVRSCIFGVVQTGAVTFSPNRDLTVQNCRFLTAPKIVMNNNVVQVLGNTFNVADTADTILEVTPPAAGNKGLLRMVGNRIPATAVFATKLRLTTGKDLTNFDVFLEDNDFTSDTSGVSDFGNAALRLTAARNRNAQRGGSEYPRNTLVASATPAVTGGTNLLTGSATPITNFTSGFEFQRIRVYIVSGHQVNNTANIVTRSGTNIVGPAVVEFIRYGSVWYEVGSPVPTTVTATTQTNDYTLALTDAGTVVEMNKATAVTLTIPTNATVAFPVGTIIEVFQLGAGTVTVAGAVGVTLRAPHGAKTIAQYSTVSLRKRAADEWVVSGDSTT